MYGENIFNPVVDEKDLPSSLQFGVDYIGYHLVIKINHFGIDRLAVGWRSIDYGEIPRPEKRKLQGSGDGSGGKGESIYIASHLTDLLLGGNSEFLLFIDDEQSKILEEHFFVEDAVSTDKNVHSA